MARHPTLGGCPSSSQPRSRVEAAGTKPKLIDEYVGRVNRQDRSASPTCVARRLGRARPAPGVRRDTVVLRGLLRGRARGRRPRRARGPGACSTAPASGCATGRPGRRRRVRRGLPARVLPRHRPPRRRLRTAQPNASAALLASLRERLEGGERPRAAARAARHLRGARPANGDRPVTVVRPADWQVLREERGRARARCAVLGDPMAERRGARPGGRRRAAAPPARACSGSAAGSRCPASPPHARARTSSPPTGRRTRSRSPRTPWRWTSRSATSPRSTGASRACCSNGGPWDLVLAADVLYLQANVRILLDLLPKLVGPGGEVWIADPGRAGAGELLGQADDRLGRRVDAVGAPRGGRHPPPDARGT